MNCFIIGYCIVYLFYEVNCDCHYIHGISNQGCERDLRVRDRSLSTIPRDRDVRFSVPDETETEML